MLVLSDAIKLDLSFRETYLVPLIVIDAERDGANWLKSWKEDIRKSKLFPSKKNAVKWDLDKEA